jgi:two-component system, OmpR family, response regulator MprA
MSAYSPGHAGGFARPSQSRKLVVTATLISDRQTTAASRPDQLVLIADGDAKVASFLDRALTTAGYRVELATDGLQAMVTFEAIAPDVVLLNRALPVLDGLEVARQLRARSSVPIVMLAGRDAPDDCVAGLDAGADDYLASPFTLEELLARVRALLRGRALAAACAIAQSRHGVLTYADVRLDQDARDASRAGRRLELRNKAFELLACFLRHPERVLSRRELLEEVWGYDFLGDSNVIEVTVGHVRQAVEAGGEPRLIHTVRPVGYILRHDHANPRFDPD